MKLRDRLTERANKEFMSSIMKTEISDRKDAEERGNFLLERNKIIDRTLAFLEPIKKLHLNDGIKALISDLQEQSIDGIDSLDIKETGSKVKELNLVLEFKKLIKAKAKFYDELKHERDNNCTEMNRLLDIYGTSQ